MIPGVDHSLTSGTQGAPQLDAAALAAFAGLPADCVEIVDVIDSTNRELMRRPARAELPPDGLAFTLLLARSQVAGRGRRGRVWHSDPADSLTFSIACEHRRTPDTPSLSGLSVALGVAAAEAVAPLVSGIGLKWPNDLMRHGRKCAGMLAETRLSGDRERIVFGWGVNLALPDELARAIDQPACGLFDAGAPRLGHEELAGRMARALIEITRQFLRTGLSGIPERWARFDVLAGREITLLEDGRPKLKGIADGLAEGGELRVLTPEGTVCVAVGDVSARLGDLTGTAGA